MPGGKQSVRDSDPSITNVRRMNRSVTHGSAGVKVVVNGPTFDNSRVKPLSVMLRPVDIAVRFVRLMSVMVEEEDTPKRIGGFPARHICFFVI